MAQLNGIGLDPHFAVLRVLGTFALKLGVPSGKYTRTKQLPCSAFPIPLPALESGSLNSGRHPGRNLTADIQFLAPAGQLLVDWCSTAAAVTGQGGDCVFCAQNMRHVGFDFVTGLLQLADRKIGQAA